MKRIPIHLSFLFIAFVLASAGAYGQSEEVSLGDVARSFRKTQAPPRAVIDNDNLAAVMEQGQDKKWAPLMPRLEVSETALKFVNEASPDITCALTYTGQKSEALAQAQSENLPASELAKLDGPATIMGESLQVSVHNGSDWSVREITVGLTILRRQVPPQDSPFASGKLIPAAATTALSADKLSDTTLLFHMKAEAGPSSTTVFQAPLNFPFSPDLEWHWAIVQAKGVPPEAPAIPLQAVIPQTSQVTIPQP